MGRPKGPGTSIGHKGLGFKSVGEITTDQPQIISGQALFQFDRERVRREVLALFGSLPTEQRFPMYAFPFPVLDDDLGADAAIVHQLLAADFSAVIRLPSGRTPPGRRSPGTWPRTCFHACSFSCRGSTSLSCAVRTRTSRR
jgi:hypothetical protein